MIDFVSLIILALIVLFSMGMAWFLASKKERNSQDILGLIREDIKDIRRELTERLVQTAKITQEQYIQSIKIVENVTQKLTKLDETNRQILEFSRQLENFQNFLKNPKQRGIFGEYLLETLLKNIFNPKYYQAQYRFKDGKVVDFVLFVGEKIIPID